MVYWVYILQSDASGQYYVGSTGDLRDRVARHPAGRVAATRNRGPWTVVYAEEFPRWGTAVVRERAIKARKSRAYVDELIRTAHVGQNGPRHRADR